MDIYKIYNSTLETIQALLSKLLGKKGYVTKKSNTLEPQGWILGFIHWDLVFLGGYIPRSWAQTPGCEPTHRTGTHPFCTQPLPTGYKKPGFLSKIVEPGGIAGKGCAMLQFSWNFTKRGMVIQVVFKKIANSRGNPYARNNLWHGPTNEIQTQSKWEYNPRRELLIKFHPSLSYQEF